MLASKDLSPFTDTIKELVESEHPVLSMAAKHFFEKRHGKRFRPTIVALMGEFPIMSTTVELLQKYLKARRA
ncbi:unnamed protein product [Scytosiphon promiscuus]